MKKIFLSIILLTIIGVGGWYAFFDKKEPVPVAVEEPIQKTPEPIQTSFYVCDEGKTVTAAFYEGEETPPAMPEEPPVPGGRVMLSFSDGQTTTLLQTISADGARYANQDESFVFWSKGNGLLVLENNEEKSYRGCIVAAPEPVGSNLSKVYANSTRGFSVRLPSFATSTPVITSTSSPELLDLFVVNESYRYTGLGSKKEIDGVKFTIPTSMATGTNLSKDTYMSVETLPQTATCTAALFVSKATPIELADGNTTYSFASSTGAAAGNRYEESVYVFSTINQCIAVRYVIRYGAIENYDEGEVKEFDRTSLLDRFDQIRRTIVVK